jgi:hypothetical protein
VITSCQLDPSAQAPWTRTTVGADALVTMAGPFG